MVPDFSSIRVLEVGTAVSVPLMGMVLSNLGADVIKVESRKKPDGNRVRVRKGGGVGKDGAVALADESFPLWHEFNGAKRSVLCNLKSDIGRDIFVDLIRRSDVFIQNFAPGWLERLGLDPQKLLEINPRLVMLFASGYGQEGPKSQQRVYASVMTALGGQEALIGEESGEVMGGMPIAFGDFNAAFHGALSIFSALYQRQSTGKGCLIDLSQIEAVTATLGEAFVEMQATGQVPSPRGNRSDHRAPHGIYPCEGADRWATVSVGSEAEWDRLIALVRSDDAALAERLAAPAWRTTAGRVQGRSEIDALLSAWTARQERSALAERLQRAGLRSAPVYESDEMESDAHFQARAFTRDVPHPRLGSLAVTSTPWLFDGATPTARAPGPALGEQTEAVLTELCGLPAERVDLYLKEGHLA